MTTPTTPTTEVAFTSAVKAIQDRKGSRASLLKSATIVGAVALTALLFVQHVRQTGRVLFANACALDLEGIVAKLASAPYRTTRPPPWVKIKNPSYSQADGRQSTIAANGADYLCARVRRCPLVHNASRGARPFL